MKAPLNDLAAKLETHRDYQSPPLHLWHPECNGDIPIYITASGDWYHDGVKIERFSLVCLFASILRREADGAYYLVTPHEKWRIEVERHPLLITDISALDGGDGLILEACLNTGRRLWIGDQYPLFLDPEAGNIAAMNLPHGLTALCTRPAWYRLVDIAEHREGESILTSGRYTFSMAIAG